MPEHAQTGVTAQTWQNMIIDSAVVYLNYGEPEEQILGATNGGVTFGWDALNFRSPEIDGLKGRIAGATRITEASPQISVNLVEWRLEAIKQAMPGATVTIANGIATLTRSKRVIPLSDHPKNIAMVGTQSGTGDPVIILLKLPLVVSGAEIPTEDESEATADLTFVGHYDPNDPEVEPWEIRWPLNEFPAVHAGNSGVDATSPHDADGEDASLVTVTLRDEQNDPIGGVPDYLFSIGLTGSAHAGPISETLTPGTYVFAVTNTEDEVVTVTVSALGVEITQTGSITFAVPT